MDPREDLTDEELRTTIQILRRFVPQSTAEAARKKVKRWLTSGVPAAQVTNHALAILLACAETVIARRTAAKRRARPRPFQSQRVRQDQPASRSRA